MPSPELGHVQERKRVGAGPVSEGPHWDFSPKLSYLPVEALTGGAGSCKIEFSAAQPLGWHQSHGWPLSFKQWQVIKIELPNLQGGEPGPNLHHNIFLCNGALPGLLKAHLLLKLTLRPPQVQVETGCWGCSPGLLARGSAVLLKSMLPVLYLVNRAIRNATCQNVDSGIRLSWVHFQALPFASFLTWCKSQFSSY